MLMTHLLDSQVEECQVVSDGDDRLGSFAAHRGAETAVELDHHQLIQHRLQGLVVRCRQGFEREDLESKD